MVRVFTFAALVGATYIAVTSADRVFVWMASRNEEKHARAYQEAREDAYRKSLGNQQ